MDLIVDNYGSHVIRTLLRVLSGMSPSEPRVSSQQNVDKPEEQIKEVIQNDMIYILLNMRSPECALY